MPGGDAPERVVFEELKKKKWVLLDARTSRDFSVLSDTCEKAMASADHHEWLTSVANKMVMGSDSLWQVMCSEWIENCLQKEDATAIIKPIEEILT